MSREYRKPWQIRRKLKSGRISHGVGWIDDNGNRCSRAFGTSPESKKAAFRFFKKKVQEGLAGSMESRKERVSWEKFTEEYLDYKESRKKSKHSIALIELTFKHFKRITEINNMDQINLKMIQDFVTIRLKDRGVKQGSSVSPATVNKELRYLRGAFDYAYKLGYLKKKIDFTDETLVEPGKEYICCTPKHFEMIYNACDAATKPVLEDITPGEFWRALITFCYLTGWRIDETVNIPKSRVDLQKGTALTVHTSNKGRKDVRSFLDPAIVSHLEGIWSDNDKLFPFEHNSRQLWVQLQKIQREAGINLDCRIRTEHVCTEACHQYSFHDFRRAFIDNNREYLSEVELQILARHADIQTTLGYINSSRAANLDVRKKLYKPDFLKKTTGR